MTLRAYNLVLALLLLISGSAWAAAIEEHTFTDAEQEARYHTLIVELRCPMCTNSNLAGSDAPIATDLRNEILSQLQEGRSDEEIMVFMKARYGDFITYRPPLNRGTALLWFGPLAALLAGLVIVRRLLAASRAAALETSLSPEEVQRLQTLLKDSQESR